MTFDKIFKPMKMTKNALPHSLHFCCLSCLALPLLSLHCFTFKLSSLLLYCIENMVKKQRRNSFHVPSLPPLGSKTEVVAAPSRRPPLLPPTGAHFLRNVNLNGNLLDIPDPPSPPKRNARRQSSPLLRPLPLHDRTNEEESGASHCE